MPPSLHYHSHDTDYDADAPAEQGVVKVWRAGSNHVDVVRDRWHHEGNRDRSMNPTEEMASALAHDVEMDDYEAHTNETSLREHSADYEQRCNVNIAKDCTAPLSRDVSDYGGGTTRLLPVDRGTLILLFRC